MPNLMCSSLTSSPLTASIFQFQSFPHHHYSNKSSLCTITPQNRRRLQIRRTILVKCSHKPLNAITVQNNANSIPPRSQLPSSNEQEKGVSVLKQFGKPIALALFWIVIGLCPIQGFQAPAIAAPRLFTWWKSKGDEQTSHDHEYSVYTRRLLEAVSKLLRTMKEVRSVDEDLWKVGAALNEVKLKSKELQEEIKNLLDAELSACSGQQGMLLDKIRQIEKAEQGLILSWMNASFNEDVGKVGELEEEMCKCEIEYNETLDEIDKLEAEFKRRETMSLSIGIRELSFIQRESELLFESYIRNLCTKKKTRRVPKRSLTKLSRDDIKKGLQAAQRQLLEQTILPSALEYEGIEHPFQRDAIDFAHRIKQTVEDSRDMQRNLEDNIRKKMKKFGNEKRSIISTPVDEVVKGYPEVQSKWTFGKKEIVIPEAASLHLFGGWKKWLEKAKSNLKKDLLKNKELGKEYVAQRQEHILRDRDRVASKTWYNDERKTWEMNPVAAPFVVSRNLLESARIRHDWGAMYLTLKGDDRQFYVDLKKFDMLFEDFGGFDALYLRMIASGVPVVSQVMWIPLYELDIGQQLRVAMRFSQRLVKELWNFKYVLPYKRMVLEQIDIFHEDIVAKAVFPIIELIPDPIRMKLGMAWQKGNESRESSWYFKWLSEMLVGHQNRYEYKKRDEFGLLQYALLLLKSYVYGTVLLTILRFVRKNLPTIPALGPLRTYNDNPWKVRRVLLYTVYRYISLRFKRNVKVDDPVTEAYDNMKRIKNPPIPLKDFSSIDSMREEINEIVAFLQNPYVFQEMGARAPRGVLIVGEKGTGKTSLAMAIAAEAKVPVVSVQAHALENEKNVGVGAANIRELFRTARDLAPIIIFVEDFDQFAGVRGKYVHTKKQDHEAFINQLLVELDGFQNQDGVLLLATTRNEKEVDEALRRPGRMDRTIHLHQPTQGEREKILRVSAKMTMDKELIDFVDWKKVAEKTSLLRPIELQLVPLALEGNAFKFKFLDYDEVLTYVSWFATFGWIIPTWVRKTMLVRSISRIFVNHLGMGLTKEDLKNVVDLMEPYGQITDGLEMTPPPVEWTRGTKFPHAVWAAGRCLIAHLLPNFDVVESIWLEPSSWKGIGCTKITRAKIEGLGDGNVESRSYLEKQLVFCFGSYIASELLLPYGEENILSNSELDKAREIATRMVIQHGWGPDGNPAVYHYGKAKGTMGMGENQRLVIAEKVEKMYYLAYDKANSMLQSNRLVLEGVVEALLDYEMLSGKDFDKIVTDNGGIFEKEPFSLTNFHVNEPVFRSLIENGNALSTAVLSSDN
jgi:hypothetical protein